MLGMLGMLGCDLHAVRMLRWLPPLHWLPVGLLPIDCKAPSSLSHLSVPAAGPTCPPAGVPFRETHHISGAAVKLAEDRGCELSALTVADLQGIHPLFGEDVTEVRGCWLCLPCPPARPACLPVCPARLPACLPPPFA